MLILPTEKTKITPSKAGISPLQAVSTEILMYCNVFILLISHLLAICIVQVQQLPEIPESRILVQALV